MQTHEPIELQRARCREYRDRLRRIARIHTEIDAPSRNPPAGEPNWSLRLRKVCLHVAALTKYDVSIDGLHAMTPELRAAYEQMHVICKHLPAEFRSETDGEWWREQASGGLAPLCHPSAVKLFLSFCSGGFGKTPDSHLLVSVWIGRLACAYALALVHLARTLGVEADFEARLSVEIRSKP